MLFKGGLEVHHPNHIEGYGVRLLKQQKLASANAAALCACPCDPVVAVVTINRVQGLFKNPVYQTPGQESSEVPPEILDQLLRATLRETRPPKLAEDAEADVARAMSGILDASPEFLHRYWGEAVFPAGFEKSLTKPCTWPPTLLLPAEAYRSSYLDSVHVPLLVDCMPRSVGAPEPVVSWLMPVKDTPSRWLTEAMNSIRSQSCMAPAAWELVVIDDGSKNEETLFILDEWRKLPNIKVLSSETSRGVGAALNIGWKHCRGRYIARLDGDDIALPSRLSQQLSFLEEHPSISILGGGFRSFTEDEQLGMQIGARQYRMPCHPLLASRLFPSSSLCGYFVCVDYDISDFDCRYH